MVNRRLLPLALAVNLHILLLTVARARGREKRGRGRVSMVDRKNSEQAVDRDLPSPPFSSSLPRQSAREKKMKEERTMKARKRRMMFLARPKQDMKKE